MLLADLTANAAKLRQWERASDWLNKLACHPLDDRARFLLDQCRFRFGGISWWSDYCSPVTDVFLTAKELGSFLSTARLNDRMIDAGASYIMTQCSRRSRIYITPCFWLGFLDHLCRQHNLGNLFHPSARLDAAIHSRSLDILYIPLHRNNH